MRMAVMATVLVTLALGAGQAQTPAGIPPDQALVQYLTKSLSLSQEQVNAVWGFMRDAQKQRAALQTQYFGNPTALSKVTRQALIDFGKKVETILTPDQAAIYPQVKQNLYNKLQAYYEQQVSQKNGQEAETRERQEATPARPD
jgi:hypothetical protein